MLYVFGMLLRLVMWMFFLFGIMFTACLIYDGIKVSIQRKKEWDLKPSLKQTVYQHNDCYYQQKMNQAGSHVKHKVSRSPKENKNDDNNI